MVAYVLPKTHASGVPRNRIRALLARPSNKRQARVGEVVALDAAVDQTERKRLGVRPVVFRARLALDDDGVRRVIEPTVKAGDPVGDLIARIANNAERGHPAATVKAGLKQLASLLGYRSWAKLREAFPGDEVEIIGWGERE